MPNQQRKKVLGDERTDSEILKVKVLKSNASTGCGVVQLGKLGQS